MTLSSTQIEVSGLKHAHTVVQPSPPSPSRTPRHSTGEARAHQHGPRLPPARSPGGPCSAFCICDSDYAKHSVADLRDGKDTKGHPHPTSGMCAVPQTSFLELSVGQCPWLDINAVKIPFLVTTHLLSTGSCSCALTRGAEGRALLGDAQLFMTMPRTASHPQRELKPLAV